MLSLPYMYIYCILIVLFCTSAYICFSRTVISPTYAHIDSLFGYMLRYEDSSFVVNCCTFTVNNGTR